MIHLKRFAILVVVQLLLYYASFAQHYSLAVSNESQGDVAKGLINMKFARQKAVVPAGKGYISLIKKSRDASSYEGAMLIAYDGDLNVVARQEMLEGVKNANIGGLVNMSGKVFFIYSLATKTNYTLYASEINPVNLSIVNEPVQLAEFIRFSEYESSYFRIIFSADSTKMAFLCPHSDLLEQNRLMEFIVLDNKLTKLYSKEYLFQASARETELQDFYLANDQSLCVTYELFTKASIGKKYIKENGTKVPPYELRFLRIAERESSDVLLATNGNFIQSLNSFSDRSGMINIVGVYQEDIDEQPTGVYRIKFSPDEKKTTFISARFPEAVLSRFTKRASFKLNAHSDAYYNTKPAKLFEVGNTITSFEQVFETPTVVSGTQFYNLYYDIIVYTFLPDGTTRFSVIPMDKQRSVYAFHQASPSLYYHKDHFEFINNYGANSEYKKETGLYRTTIDTLGNVTGTSLISSEAAVGGKELDFLRSVRYGNRILGMAHKKDENYLCTLNITE